LDKVLVLVRGKGGVLSASMLSEMMAPSGAPMALVFDRTNTIIAEGAACAGLTLVDRFELGNPTALIGGRRGPHRSPTGAGEHLQSRPRPKGFSAMLPLQRGIGANWAVAIANLALPNTRASRKQISRAWHGRKASGCALEGFLSAALDANLAWARIRGACFRRSAGPA
jgi:hypothetical protein